MSVQSLGIIDAGTRVADTGINGFAPANGNGGASPECAFGCCRLRYGQDVPSNSGGRDQGLTNLCGRGGGSDANGCILVVTGQNDGDDTTPTTTAKKGKGPKNCVAQGAPVMEVSRRRGEAAEGQLATERRAEGPVQAL